jgi:cellulose synthase/poly-beta-1,6-N-acetylglucosamine synthase-like glycosyltransferase
VTLLWAGIALGLAWLAFAYLGYPALLWLLARLAPRPVAAADAFPPLSVIIAVHNGEGALARKLEQTLALHYPGVVEILVTSDGSTDATEAIAASYTERGVRLVRSPVRGGKESAQARAISEAKGEILVFTDVTAEVEPEALRWIARPFADATVGCVSSEDRVALEGGEGAYVRYEMALRRLESEAATIVGCSGSFFAVRRELASPWPSDLASDFRSALEAARRGLRAVSEPRARASFRTVADPRAEWQRKVRTVRRGIAVLMAYRSLLHPRHGRAALALWGHKVARFTSPFALLLVFASSALAANASSAAAALLTAQAALYGLGGLALAFEPVRRSFLARLAGFFMLVNASMLVAWARHLSGQRAVTWEPTRR